MSEIVSSSGHKGVGRGNGSSIPKAAFVDLIAREMAAVPGPGAYTIVRDGDPIHLRPATATGDGRDVPARAKPVHTPLRTKSFSLTSKPRGLLPAKREDFAPRGDYRIKSRPKQCTVHAVCVPHTMHSFCLRVQLLHSFCVLGAIWRGTNRNALATAVKRLTKCAIAVWTPLPRSSTSIRTRPTCSRPSVARILSCGRGRECASARLSGA